MSKVNYNVLPLLAMWAAFEARLNDENLWKTIKTEVNENMKYMNFDDMYLLNYASKEMKPKHTSPQFNKDLLKSVS